MMEDNEEDMKDEFLRSLIKNMSDGMVDEVRKSKMPVPDEPTMDDDIQDLAMNVDDEDGADRDEEEKEDEDKITNYMRRIRPMNSNRF